MDSVKRVLKYVTSCSVIASVFFCVSASAEESVSCVPKLLSVDNKYYIESAGEQIVSVKVLEIDAATCWIKVKELGVDSVPDEYVVARKKKRYWINLRNVFSIQNK